MLSSNQVTLTCLDLGWLVDMHQKLWGRLDLVGEIFRVADLTTEDFIELQRQLHDKDPSRSSESYHAKDVLAMKAKFLRSHSRGLSLSDITTCASSLPQLRVDTSKGHTNPDDPDASDEDEAPASMDDNDDADTDASDAVALMDAMNINADANSDRSCRYIEADAASPSKGSNAIFPCTIQYMDLSFLCLEDTGRYEALMLIRDEWRFMVDIFNKRRSGMGGGAIFSGQPGIGEYRYYS
jgi:hypothetical protein